VLEAAAEENRQAFVASECPLAAVHILQGISRLPIGERLPPARPYHPIEIFALSYDLVRDAQ
jgi:glycerol-3-phosphate dehydrogenase subunit C